MARRIGMSRVVVIPCLLEHGSIEAQGSRPADHRILFVGTVQPRKGVDVWAHSLNIVLRRRSDARAELIGPDTMTAPGDASMTDHVRHIIASDLRRRFFWRGALTHEQTLRAIACASLVVVPSRFESFGYVGAEALLRGRPVVMSDQVGLAEWTGRIATVPAGDAGALAGEQLRILADLPHAERDSARCRARLVDACSPERHFEARASFVAALDRRVRRIARGRNMAHDAIERMRRFLTAVEKAEQTAGHHGTAARLAQGRHALR